MVARLMVVSFSKSIYDSEMKNPSDLYIGLKPILWLNHRYGNLYILKLVNPSLTRVFRRSSQISSVFQVLSRFVQVLEELDLRYTYGCILLSIILWDVIVVLDKFYNYPDLF